jgi:dTDP-4-amino-4,6-dideoxygalactose transaminase
LNPDFPETGEALASGKDLIQVTRSLAPSPALYGAYLEQIFSGRRFTNQGELSARLEAELASRLGVPRLGLCANGTLALQLGLHVSGLAGKEVITTPFSYVAGVSALLWEGCVPVFADIDEETLCLDPRSVAERITPRTAGLMPVHIYGNACAVEDFSALALEAGLVLLYDAAQAFGSSLRGRSLADFGDYAAYSFHATKVFHTVEGGGLVMRGEEDYSSFSLLRACGHRGDEHVLPGLNAKLSELHAAMGLSLLGLVEGNIAARAEVSRIYDELLPERGLRRPKLREGLFYNHAYYPVVFEREEALLRAVDRLNREGIFPRRYFYPALNTLPYLEAFQPCPVAESAARRALCLPLYAELEEHMVEKITRMVKQSI